MPAIPIYQQRTDAGGQLRVQADPSAFGAPQAQAGQRIGAALNDIGMADALGQRQNERLLKEQEEKDARAWTGKAVSGAMLDWTKTLQERQQQALPGAPEFTPGVLADFDEYAGKLVESAPTKAAKEFAQAHMTQMRTQIGEQSLRFESQARVGLRVDNAEASIINAAKVVQQNPAQYGAMLQLVRETMPDVGQDQNKRLNDHAIASMTAAAAAHALEADPYQVREVTGKALGANGFSGKTGTAWVDDATADQVRQWNNAADVKIKQAEAGKARDQDASAKLAVDSVQKLRTFVTDGQAPDASYQAEVRMLTRGMPWADEAESLIAAGIKGAGFGAQTLPRQALLLQSLEGQPTSPETAAEIKHARGVFEAQSAAFKADPWEAGSRFQRLPPVPAVPITNGAQLLQVAQQRVPLMNTLEAASGKPAPLLRPEEVPQAIQALQAMPPAARAETLGRVGASLSVERLNAFAEQLDKGSRPLALTLKLGTDRTTAGRMTSELVQRGAQALADKTVKRDDTALAGWRAEIAGMVRGTLGDDRAESDVIDAAYYVRAAMDQGGIEVPGFNLTASARNAVKLVAGEPLERNGVKTLLPRTMDESTFDARLQQSMSGGNLAALKASSPDGMVYLRGQPILLDRVAANLQRYGYTRDAHGAYLPSTGGAFITMDKAGRVPLSIVVGD